MKKGSILAVCVVLILVVALIGLGLARLGTDARVKAAKTTVGIVARSAADAGLSHAKMLMRKKHSAEEVWNDSTLPQQLTPIVLPGTNSSYTFDVNGTSTTGYFIITSVGTNGTAVERVYGRLDVGSLWKGVGVKGGIIIMNDAEVHT